MDISKPLYLYHNLNKLVLSFPLYLEIEMTFLICLVLFVYSINLINLRNNEHQHYDQNNLLLSLSCQFMSLLCHIRPFHIHYGQIWSPIFYPCIGPTYLFPLQLCKWIVYNESIGATHCSHIMLRIETNYRINTKCLSLPPCRGKPY